MSSGNSRRSSCGHLFPYSPVYTRKAKNIRLVRFHIHGCLPVGYVQKLDERGCFCKVIKLLQCMEVPNTLKSSDCCSGDVVNVPCPFLKMGCLIWCRGLNQAATNFQAFDQGRIAAHRLYEMISRILPTAMDVTQIEARTLSQVQGNIELRNVYFSYPSSPDIPILSGLYLTIPARKTVALVGSNGSGKSSVISLVERFYDPTLGVLLLFIFRQGDRC